MGAPWCFFLYCCVMRSFLDLKGDESTSSISLSCKTRKNVNDVLGGSETKEEECNLPFRFLFTNQKFSRSFKTIRKDARSR